MTQSTYTEDAMQAKGVLYNNDLVKQEPEDSTIQFQPPEQYNFIESDITIKTDVDYSELHPQEVMLPPCGITFQCDFCSFQYTSRTEIDQHLDSQHPLCLTCSFCGEKFRTEYAMSMHTRKLHWNCGKEYLERLMTRKQNDSLQETCHICGIATTEIIAHMKWHGAKYFCHICNKGFMRPGDLGIHLKEHPEYMPKVIESAKVNASPKVNTDVNILVDDKKNTEKVVEDSVVREKGMARKLYICEICGKIYNARSSFSNHMTQHRGNKRHNCTYCGESFSYKHTLFSHQVRIHGAESRWICHFCGKVYTSKHSLESHENTHTGARPYTCDLCPETFKSSSALSLHRNDHITRDYKCSVCELTFTKRSEFYKHRASHKYSKAPRSRKYCCNLCDHRAKSQKELTHHIRIHTGEKPFQCDLCGNCFRQKSDVVNHIKTHFKIRKFKCKECGKRFARPGNLKAHEIIHTGIRPSVCRICSHSFTQINSLKRHLKSFHKAKYHKCNQCELDFDVKTELRQHCRDSH